MYCYTKEQKMSAIRVSFAVVLFSVKTLFPSFSTEVNFEKIADKGMRRTFSFPCYLTSMPAEELYFENEPQAMQYLNNGVPISEKGFREEYTNYYKQEKKIEERKEKLKEKIKQLGIFDPIKSFDIDAVFFYLDNVTIPDFPSLLKIVANERNAKRILRYVEKKEKELDQMFDDFFVPLNNNEVIGENPLWNEWVQLLYKNTVGIGKRCERQTNSSTEFMSFYDVCKSCPSVVDHFNFNRYYEMVNNARLVTANLLANIQIMLESDASFRTDMLKNEVWMLWKARCLTGDLSKIQKDYTSGLRENDKVDIKLFSQMILDHGDIEMIEEWNELCLACISKNTSSCKTESYARTLFGSNWSRMGRSIVSPRTRTRKGISKTHSAVITFQKPPRISTKKTSNSI